MSADSATGLTAAQLLLLFGSCGAGILGKIVFDWLKTGRGNGLKPCLTRMQSELEWLHEFHDQRNGEGRPLSWPPIECKTNIPKVLEELNSSHDILNQINASLKIQNELLSKILTASREK
jgi:hypothetical protein